MATTSYHPHGDVTLAGAPFSGGINCIHVAEDSRDPSEIINIAIVQASFDPPGLSVAVKKDRAAEGLLAIGSKFVVNILAEGREKPVIKQLLKQFKPGEDRFAGLDTQACTGPPVEVMFAPFSWG